MHKLIDYICEELEQLEQKVSKEKQLSMQDIQLMDTLAHAKKNLLKCEEMEEGSSYAMSRDYYKGGGYGSYNSYARGRGRNAMRDSMGRYSRDDGASYEEGYSRAEDDMMNKIRQKLNAAPDERTRRILNDLMTEMS